MTRHLTDSAIRAALGPGAGIADTGLAASIAAGVRTTPQRRRSLVWPWHARPDATWPEARRAGAIRAALVAILVIATLTVAAVGARLILPRHAPAQLLAVRNGQLVAADAGATGRVPAALAGHRVRDFNVSPDGARIATLSEAFELEVWDAAEVLNDEAAVPTVIPGLPGSLLGFGMDWVPGRNAILMAVSQHGLHRLYIVDVASRTWLPVSEADLAVTAYWPAPDARHVAIVGQLHGRFGLWIADLETGTATSILAPDAGVQAIALVTWSPDSGRLAFTGQPRGSNLVAIWVADADGAALHQITPFEQHAALPMWSPDGAWIAYLRDAGRGSRCVVDLSIVRPDGTDARLVFRDAPAIDWDADSSGLIVETDQPVPGGPLGAIAEIGLDGAVKKVLLPLDLTDDNGSTCHPYSLLTHWYRGTR
jgi:dipeptidyl aminopeptidase/acylaminoacyl peptidase